MLFMAFCVELDVSSANQPDPIFRLLLNGTVLMVDSRNNFMLSDVRAKQSCNMPPPMSVRLSAQEPACQHPRMQMWDSKAVGGNWEKYPSSHPSQETCGVMGHAFPQWCPG